MSYVMEYAKENPNDEIIEDKGVRVFVDSAAVMYLLGLKWIIKKTNYHLHLFLTIQMKLKDAVGEFKI